MSSTTYHAEEDETPTTAVVSAVSTHSEENMLEQPELYHTINTDALNKLFPSWNESVNGQHLTFSYADYRITVFNCGMVEVERAV